MKKVLYLLLAASILFLSGFGVYKGIERKSQIGLYNKPLEIINARDILPYQDKTPKIAIIDTGVDLGNKYLSESNISQESLNLLTSSSQQLHGTMVSGILVSDGNGHSQPGGLVPNAQVLSIQAGTDMGLTSKDLAEAIEVAIENDCKVINISLATKKNTDILKAAVDKALAKGIIIVASSGNEGESEDYYPAAYDGVIGVGSVDLDGNIMGKPNLDNIEIFAPGEDILTSTVSESEKGLFEGSSASTPIVSAAFITLITMYPNLSSEELKDLVISNGDLEEFDKGTYNVLNLQKAVEAADGVYDKDNNEIRCWILFIGDNVLQGGRVYDDSNIDFRTEKMLFFNERMASNPNLVTINLFVKGLSIGRVKESI
ncbi:S8 family serine peptidase [Metabacillus bambusae]|uniref:S8 family serine peptidase n=1 Tax=Metabacillus bambusae TaxID=2795218 RepID=A0ABS3N9V1_9BACI|nr:S8 family serine peptidase [Metabacillus bambusae]MBO1514998.1 S8 family serine peptidase [Metabacillus bambusae]